MAAHMGFERINREEIVDFQSLLVELGVEFVNEPLLIFVEIRGVLIQQLREHDDVIELHQTRSSNTVDLPNRAVGEEIRPSIQRELKH